ncbi:interleukin-12 receptor subunit beta-2 [Indicator indicator]|uniref:interleukin-12 receptor subunit beta-2 n=1 Tax=Indicator indicator TaxID=1002788 RepID=UPI0023DECFB5|nr:interleukin-12 receptor subunit beta-2 [Indicator indicator]
MLQAWIVLTAVGLLVNLKAEPCRKGTLSSDQPPLSTTAAEVCDKGNMTTNTAPQVQPGASISLSCQLQAVPSPQQCSTAIFVNGSQLSLSPGRSSRASFVVRAYGRHTFTCKQLCHPASKLRCGLDVEAGNPPDEPQNVSCIQYGTNGHPTCTWDKGRLTYLSTTYLLQLSNRTDVLCFSEEGVAQEGSSLALSKLSFDSWYKVVVVASNKLGSARSEPLLFMPIDIVKPHPPKFWVEFENSSEASCTSIWSNETQERHCRLRYRPLSKHSWSMVESLGSVNWSLCGLEPHTAYEFQLSCKIHPERGLWSNWHSYQAWPPEAVPAGLLDVWYRQQDVDSHRQNISLFWKALSKSEARGRILQYTVTFEALDPWNSSKEAHVITQTSYTRAMPRVDYKITVTAENSRGSSPPATIMTNLGTQDLPPPQKVSAIAMGKRSILVSWKPPTGSAVPISGYVVEWAGTERDTHTEPPPAWVKLPASNLSTLLTEQITEKVCYHIKVFALYQARAGQVASVTGISTAEAPSAGLQIYTPPQAEGLLVSWEAIPAHQQRGCSTGYQTNLGSRDGPGALAISNTSGQPSLDIPDLQPGNYILWVTAPTAAGERPSGNSELLCLESAGDWLTLVLTCSLFILLACACSVPPVRKALHQLLSRMLPQGQSKAIPDPANATWVKNHTAMKAELMFPSSLFLPDTSSYEEPETIQVEEETFLKINLQDKLLLGTTGRSGNGDWPAESGSGQEEPGYLTLPGTTDGEVDEQQLPHLYKRMVVEVMEPAQTVSEYITNPITDMATTYLPLVPGTPEELPELECEPLSIFPTASLMPSYGGNLTLDQVKINCSSVRR